MSRGKIEVTASISYFDFDFGNDVLAADAFCKVARATLTEPRCVDLNVKYLSPIMEEEEEVEPDHEEVSE